MDANDKTIRFIDSDYRELFRIPDGANIKIFYPPDDDRGTVTRQCRYLDDMHVELGGSGSYRNTYHICEFAEQMERIGARYEPEVQLREAELTSFTPGEEKFYTYNREEGKSCIGHYAGDFGQSGDRYFCEWRSRENDRNTLEFQTELHSAVYALRQYLLKDYGSMLSYCKNHPEAMLDSGDNYKRYGFKLETETRRYYTQCFFGENKRDARFIIYAYENAALELGKAQPAFGIIQPGTADEREMFYRNDAEGNLSVGYLRGDFGRGGNEFHYNWFDSETGRGKKTPEFQAEFQTVMDTLRQDVLKDLKSTQDYCYKHPEAQLPGDIHRYCFKVETESRQFFVRCTVLREDYFYVFAYDKAAAREQERPAEKPSVLKQIRDAEKAPKPPCKDKVTEKGKKKDGEEL